MADSPQPPPLPRPPEPFRDLSTPRSGGTQLADADRVVGAIRALGDTLHARLDLLAQGPEQVVIPAAPAVPMTPVPPSKGKAAAKVVGKSGLWLTSAIGVLGIVAQIVHVYRPTIEGPINGLIKLLNLLGGTQ